MKKYLALLLAFCMLFSMMTVGAEAATVKGLFPNPSSGNTGNDTPVRGDADGDAIVTKDDAIYVLMHTFFDSEYAANQDFDFDSDGDVTKDDAIYVLMYTFFPNEYPLPDGTPPKKIISIDIASMEQLSMITGYQSVLDKTYIATIDGTSYQIPKGSLMGFASTNDTLCKAVNFGSADLGIPIYDADNNKMYMVWGDTFSTHGHGDFSAWWDYQPSFFWNNMTLARSNDTTYASLADGFNIAEFLTGTNVSGKPLQNGVWADGVNVKGQIASPINRITDTGDKETSKLSTGGLIIDGTIYLFYSSNGTGVSTMFHYSSCVKSTDGGKTWERVHDLTWNAYDLDDFANANKLGVENQIGYLDAVGLFEDNDGVGASRIYTLDPNNTDITFKEENGDKYLALRTLREQNYRSFNIDLNNEVRESGTYKVKVEFRPTEGFKLQSGKTKPLFLRFSENLAVGNDVAVYFDDLIPDANGWFTAEADLTSAVNSKQLRVFTYASRGHGVDIRSITVTDAETGATVFSFTADGVIDSFNKHTAYHFTQFTPVQDKVGNGKYIYFYGQGSYREDDIYLARVPKAQLESFDAYEYFAGRDADGTSVWTKDPAEAKPLVELQDGGSSISVAYNKGIGKWMLTYFGVNFGNRVRFADTIDGEYTDGYTFISNENVTSFINYEPNAGYPFSNYTKGTYNIYGAYVNSQWISEDGLSFYCILSQFHDCYNVSLVKVKLDVEFEK